jgi:hypothetical protein
MAGVRISGLSNVTSADTTHTDDLTVTDDVAIGGDLAVTGTLAVTGAATMVNVTATGTVLAGNAAADLIGFYDGTGITQRASSNQASTNVATSASFGATQLAAVQEIMATLTALKLWKGAA